MTVTFDYFCTRCDAAFCERVNLLNLALDYTEDGFCLDCLAKDQSAESPWQLVMQLLPYIHSRDCFKNPWQAQQVTACPKLTEGTCYCQDDAP